MGIIGLRRRSLQGMGASFCTVVGPQLFKHLNGLENPLPAVGYNIPSSYILFFESQ